MNIRISVLITMMVASQAFAIVDMKNANFSETWTDLQIPGAGYDLRVTRAYNSRSLFNGMFGFGWCSNFETKLDVTAENSLKVTECGDGLDINYTPKSFKGDSIDRVAEEIIKAEKKSNPAAPSKYLSDLKKRVKTTDSLRAQLAAKYKIKGTVDDNVEFLANGSSVEKVVKKKDVYIRTLVDGTSQKFDIKGALTHVYDRNGNFLKFNYRGDLLAEVVDNTGRKLTFSYYPNTKKVKEIVGPNNTKSSYKYKDQSNLEYAKLATGEAFDYEYDDLHNLINIKYPDGTTKKLKYDTNKDWVTSFQDQDKCIETYEYTVSKEDPRNHYSSNVVKKCGDVVTNKSHYEFWFKDGPNDHGKFLEKVATDINGDKTEITYHPIHKKPVSIKRNGSVVLFAYYDSGLVKTRTVGKEVTNFEYDKKLNKVSRIRVGKRTTTFDYDSKGNLTTAKNSQGQLVKLSYDDKGRIATIMDQAKRRVNIAYEERFGKPSLVERPGVGSISVSYKQTGEVNRVDSKDGPAVAVQVASAFNNLLEVISPAGIDLGL